MVPSGFLGVSLLLSTALFVMPAQGGGPTSREGGALLEWEVIDVGGPSSKALVESVPAQGACPPVSREGEALLEWEVGGSSGPSLETPAGGGRFLGFLHHHIGAYLGDFLHHRFEAFFREELFNSKGEIKRILTTRLQQYLFREGDLSVLNNDGTRAPVIHDYRDLTDWAFSFVLGARTRKVVGGVVLPYAGLFGFEGFDGALKKALMCRLELSEEEVVQGLAKGTQGMVQVIADGMVRMLFSEVPQREPRYLNSGELRDLKDRLSTNEGRARDLREGYGRLNSAEDVVDYFIFTVKEGAGRQLATILDSVKKRSVERFFEVQDERFRRAGREIASFVGLSLALAVSPPLGGAVSYCSVPLAGCFALPKFFLDRERRWINRTLESLENVLPSFVTAEEATKYYGSFVESELVKEDEGDYVHVTVKSVTPLGVFKEKVGNALGGALSSAKGVAGSAVKTAKKAGKVVVDAGRAAHSEASQKVKTALGETKKAYHAGENNRVKGRKVKTEFTHRDSVLYGAASVLATGAKSIYKWFRG